MDRLLELQRNLKSRIDPDCDASTVERLGVTTVRKLKHIHFFGDPFGESFAELLEVLADPKLAKSMASLEICGPDEGANGTRNWDLARIANCTATFPNLRHLSIEQTKPTDHNQSIIAESYDENGVLAKILAKAPRLESLVVPSAPNSEFFGGESHPILYLNIDAGYDHHRFIANLARSTRFPNLSALEFGEYNETYMEDFRARVTPFADYRELFASSAFEAIKFFRWKNPVCTRSELAKLKKLRPERHVSIVRWTCESL